MKANGGAGPEPSADTPTHTAPCPRPSLTTRPPGGSLGQGPARSPSPSPARTAPGEGHSLQERPKEDSRMPAPHALVQAASGGCVRTHACAASRRGPSQAQACSGGWGSGHQGPVQGPGRARPSRSQQGARGRGRERWRVTKAQRRRPGLGAAGHQALCGDGAGRRASGSTPPPPPHPRRPWQDPALQPPPPWR